MIASSACAFIHFLRQNDNNSDIQDKELAAYDIRNETLIRQAAISGAIGCIIGSLPFIQESTGLSITDRVARNMYNSGIFGVITSIAFGSLSYFYAQLTSSSIASLCYLEEQTRDKYEKFITISHELRDNLLQKKQEASQLFFMAIQKENICYNAPFAQASHTYKLILLRMNRILEYVEKARGNSPNNIEKIILQEFENRANDTIEKVETALLCI